MIPCLLQVRARAAKGGKGPLVVILHLFVDMKYLWTFARRSRALDCDWRCGERSPITIPSRSRAHHLRKHTKYNRR